VASGDCLSCHDPHGSATPGSLAKAIPALCADCHDLGDADLRAKHQGAQLEGTNCMSCHTPHESKEAGLLAANRHPGFVPADCAKCHTVGKPPGKASLKVAGAQLCASCHGAIAKPATAGAVVHAPVAAGRCVECHTPHASDRPSQLLARGDQLCAKCHAQVQKDAALSHGHPPAREGTCTSCHDPHQSAIPGLLKAKSVALCGKCHQQLMDRIQKGSPHAPVASGMCGACHTSHGSDNVGMTRRAGSAVCTSCHSPTGPKITAAHPGMNANTADCLTCHDPHVQQKGAHGLRLPVEHVPYSTKDCNECHATKTGGALVARGQELCFRCHEDLKESLKKAHLHPALQEKAQCLTCHSPHAGASQHVLRRDESRLCFTCHNQDSFKGKFRHAALDQGCTTCHDPHASDDARMLKQKTVAVCTNCHADLSKHYHPVKDKVDPRTGLELTCVGCHRPHSSDFEHLLQADPEVDLCIQCHDPSMGPKRR
jgi:predicted CXXCH cytochrome family protein